MARPSRRPRRSETFSVSDPSTASTRDLLAAWEGHWTEEDWAAEREVVRQAAWDARIEADARRLSPEEEEAARQAEEDRGANVTWTPAHPDEPPDTRKADINAAWQGYLIANARPPVETPITPAQQVELDGLVEALGGCACAIAAITDLRAARRLGELVVIDGVPEIDRVLGRLGGYDGALALLAAIRDRGAAELGLVVDDQGRFCLPSGAVVPHPSHGPPDSVPRLEGGGLHPYYQEDKALSDRDGIEPPPRQYRAGGWNPEVQANFITELAESGSVTRACRAVRRSRQSAYNLRRQSPDFARAWDAALASTLAMLEETAIDRALNGQEEAVYHKGQCVGHRIRFDNRLLFNLLRARAPAAYRPPHGRERGECEPTNVAGKVAEQLRLTEEAWQRRAPDGDAGAVST